MPPHDKPDSELTEAEYLARQVELAKQAMSRAWHDVAAGLGQGIDPREWTRDYPWVALTGAAVGGFVAAVALIPSKEDQALKKLAALERALNPPKVVPVAPDDQTDASGAPRKSAFSGILFELFRALGPALSSAVTAAVTAKASDNAEHNGHEPAPGESPPAEPHSNAP